MAEAAILPSHLLIAMTQDGCTPRSRVAYDTETSGLFADDGARVSTLSIAFMTGEGADLDQWLHAMTEMELRTQFLTRLRTAEFAPNHAARIFSIAWPFDQGLDGKPEQKDQAALWLDAENLDQAEWRALLRLLEHAGREIGLTTHNRKFDHEKVRVGVRRWPGVGVDLDGVQGWDTQNVNHLLYPLEPTSLKPTYGRLTGIEEQDEVEQVKKYLKKSKLPAGRWDLIPWDIIGPYADGDAYKTLVLELRQRHDINTGQAWCNETRNHGRGWTSWAIDRRFRTTEVLYRMERRGLPYDEIGSRAAAKECQRRAAEIGKTLPFEPTDPAAKEYFFGSTDKKTARGAQCCGLEPYAMTDKGGVSMTAEVLGRMVEDDVPWAAKWAEYRKVSNAASMWYQAYADGIGPDGRLRTCYRQNGTVSSRFSVERVNLQAIPQDYRLEGFGALDGIPTPRQLIARAVPARWRIYELDLAQAELRVAAQYAKCEPMLQMIEDGADLHAYTTKNLFPEIEEGSDLWFRYRQVGKRANFSLGFRAQGKTFAAMVSKETGIRLEAWQADKIVRDWNALFPEFARANDQAEKVVESRQRRYGRGWIEFANGERRWYGRYDDPSSAFNQRVQGNLAQFGIDWMLLSDQELRTNRDLEWRWRKDGIGEAGLVLTIHDSQVLLLPDDEQGQAMAAECAALGQTLWENTFTVPGGVDYHAWDKGEVKTP